MLFRCITTKVSKNVAKHLFFQTIPIVHLEDVYITGLCASSCHLRREHDKGFKARPMDKISEYQIQVITFSIENTKIVIKCHKMSIISKNVQNCQKCLENVKKMSRKCHENVKKISRKCQENVRKLSIQCQKNVKKFQRNC